MTRNFFSGTYLADRTTVALRQVCRNNNGIKSERKLTFKDAWRRTQKDGIFPSSIDKSSSVLASDFKASPGTTDKPAKISSLLTTSP